MAAPFEERDRNTAIHGGVMARTHEHHYRVTVSWSGNLGSGRFTKVVLHPTVTVTAGSDVVRARALHKPAHEKCFIANSMNFPIECEPQVVAAS